VSGRRVRTLLALLAVEALLAGGGAAGDRDGTRWAPPGGDAEVLPAVDPAVAGSGRGAAGEQAQADHAGRVDPEPTPAFTHFRVGNRNVKSLLIDESRLWVGTSGGLIRYDTRTEEYRLYDVTSGLLSNGIFYVGKIGGRIAVGTYGGGLSILDATSHRWENYNVPQGLADPFVYGVLEASNGDLWIATWSGANRVRGAALRDRRSWEVFTVENTRGGLPNDWVYALAEGRAGEIWLATEGGLARFARGAWSSWNHAKGLGAPFDKVKNDIQLKNDPSRYSQHHERQKRDMGLGDVTVAYNPNYVVSMAVDGDGVVWAGTWGGGLARFDGKVWTNYTMADGLPGNHVFMLHLDGKRRLWIGTNNGLARLDKGRFVVLTMRDGLFANDVFSMATESDGSMWIGSYGGVAHVRLPAAAK
jgi:ligand-binding sensor domain-containing protein